MSKAQFQGYARGKGFENVDPGYSILSRMREKQNQDIANLKEQQREARNRDLQAEDDLEKVQRNEEANRKDIYIEGQTIQARQSALKANENTFIQNNNAKLKKFDRQQEDLKKIIQYSQTALESFERIRQKNWDATAEASYNYYMTHPTPIEDQIKTDVREEANWRWGEAIEQTADQMARDGFSNEQVALVRYKNSASDYGRLKAYSVIAGSNFGSWAEKKLAEKGARSSAEKEALLDKLRIEYLKQHKLYNVSSDFLEPMFQKMRSQSASILSKSRHVEAVESTQLKTRQHEEVFRGALLQSDEAAGEALNNLFVQRTRELKPNGYAYTNAEAKEYIFEFIETLPPSVSDRQIRNIFYRTKLLSQNNTWGDANGSQLDNALSNRKEKEKTKARLRELEAEAIRKDLKQKAHEFFKDPTQWNGDIKAGQNAINELIVAGIDVDEFRPYLDQSKQSLADGDEVRRSINNNRSRHTLTVKDLNNPYVPDDLKKEYMDEALKNDALFGTIDFKPINNSLSSKLKSKLQTLNIEEQHSSFFTALEEAKFLVRDYIKNQGGDITKAHEYVLNMIDKPNGLFEVTSSAEALNDQAFFNSFTPGTHNNEPKIANLSDPLKIENKIREIEEDPTLIETELLAHPMKYEEIVNNIKDGKSYRLPEIYFKLSASNPEKWGTPVELWTKNLKAAFKNEKLPNLDIKDFRKTLFRDVEDPKAKIFINNIRTKADLLKSIQIHNNPTSTRNPIFMSNLVQRKLNVPSVVEAILTREQMRDDETKEYQVNPNPLGLGAFIDYEVE